MKKQIHTLSIIIFLLTLERVLKLDVCLIAAVRVL